VTAINVDRDSALFRAQHPFDSRVLHPSVSQIIDECVAKAVNRLFGGSDAQLRFVPTRLFDGA